jgi:hypothetical protein
MSAYDGRFADEWAKTWHSHNRAVPLIVGNHNKTSDALVHRLATIEDKGCGRDFTFLAPASPARLAPQDFEDLRGSMCYGNDQGGKEMGFIAHLSRLKLVRGCDLES